MAMKAQLAIDRVHNGWNYMTKKGALTNYI
jgi:hypothetical protein